MEELVKQAQKGDAADAISDTILACWEKIGQAEKYNFLRLG